MRPLVLVAAFALTGCGRQLGELERGETGTVARAFNGESLKLNNGLVVFLAEIEAHAGFGCSTS